MKEAVMSVSKPNQDFMSDVKAIEARLRKLSDKMYGDNVKGQLDIDQAPSINNRLFGSYFDGFGATSDPTTTMKDQLQIASEEFEKALSELKSIVNTDLKALEQKLEAAGAPYTPGRIPDWRKN